MKLSLFASVVALLTASLFAPTLPAPAAARMRTGGNAARERREDNTSPSRSAACAVRSLREALSHVQIEHDFEGYSCGTLTHESIHMLLAKLEALLEFTVSEEIFQNLTFPEHIHHLLHVMNETIPSITSLVGNMTEQVSYSPLDIGSSTEQCVNSEYCSQNCGVCQANCELHRLRRGVLDLVGLLEADYVSECEVCVDPAVQRETVEMRNVLERAGDDLIPSTPLLCVHMVLMQLPVCEQPLQFLERLENLTLFLNDSLTALNGSQTFPNLQLVVERLTSSVLPETRISLETLGARDCSLLSEFISGTECVPVSLSQLSEEVASLLTGSGCGLEQRLVVGLRTLNILRYNYSHFVQRLQFLGLLA